MVAQRLGEVGIQAEVVQLEDGATLPALRAAGKVALFLYEAKADPGDSPELL